MKEGILEVISSLGSVSFEQYKKMFDELYRSLVIKEEKYKYIPHQFLYWLDCLGHCEIDYDKKQIYVSPPAFILLPNLGVRKLLLIGARTPYLLTEILNRSEYYKENISVTIDKQRYKGIPFPEVVTIEGLDMSRLIEFSQDIKVPIVGDMPTCWQLVNISANLEDYIDSLRFTIRADLNWKRRIFDLEKLYFYDKNLSSSSEMIEYTEKYTYRKIYYWVEEDKMTKVDRDWGRYLALFKGNKKIILYDKKRNILGIVNTARLPKILARGVSLCSGMIPDEIKLDKDYNDIPRDTILLLYRGVTQNIANIVSNKLNQDLVPITFNEKGDI
ncbi:hypothetical protein [Alkaliphilus oremlandii]|uniref:Uncharacterized protein n=1 Tax=Alkaliphilus oremlandii (strain OhILAs) TaxID=350688 RepID=A8MHW6_ALKOO|nr:hypothetical protein [Alkaliphilus oremlandii]ABW19398.1 hypothetical protein Clos_1858 [Alkaliphilus oremlandii OhILAs]